MCNDVEFGLALTELEFLDKHPGSNGQWTGGKSFL